MSLIDNRNKLLRDELANDLKSGSKLSVAAAFFSIYAYEELKDELEQIEQLRFIFTSPTFTKEKTEKSKREFYIPRLDRERGVYGTEFEVKLRNELTQKAIAKECADWIRRKATFKSLNNQSSMNGFISVDDVGYAPIQGFTTVDLGVEKNNDGFSLINRIEAPDSKMYLQVFNELWRDKGRLQDVTEEIIENISVAYNENSPEFIYYVTLHNVFHDFLDEVSEDTLPKDGTGFKKSKIWNTLYDFQQEAALAIINKLENYNGCILADSVGLGKTYTALAVIKYYELRMMRVLVLCPKKLSDNWMTYSRNSKKNTLQEDKFRYDVLYHTDLSRVTGPSNMGIPIEEIEWGNYDLVVIDESHNFRNGEESRKGTEKENRYSRLLNRVIKPNCKTRVLMLSATPVNNRFYDLRNQLALAYGDNQSEFNQKLKTKMDIDTIFRQAQKEYNAWSKRPEEQRTTQNLLDSLDFDFFKLLDSVTIARSRKHIQAYYSMSDIGKFPTRNKPISISPMLTELEGAIDYRQIYGELSKLELSIYTPTKFIHESKLQDYLSEEETEKFRRGREFGIMRLMRINLLKRMESSVHSFLLTVKRIYKYLYDTSDLLGDFIQKGKGVINGAVDLSGAASDFDYDDQNTDFFTSGKKVNIDLRDVDCISWKREIDADIDVLQGLILAVEDIKPEYDNKLCELKRVIREKMAHPINPGNKKIIIFTAFSDTAEYLYDNIRGMARHELGLNAALITGNIDGRTTIPNFKCDMNHVLSCFSPVSKSRDLIYKEDINKNIDILIATDCISEGQNLQDCDYLVNYDIHWNPVRIIQRFGRIDRIGSKNDVIQLVNFWPNLDLDEYINLKARVEDRMRISILTSTGDDDYINQDEKGDLDYRREQLKRLHDEVVDLEDMNRGVSITDLGLNDFRMDLMEYKKTNPNVELAPHGMHAVVRSTSDLPSGVIFVLQSISEKVKIDKQNQLHPYYLVYISDDGSIVYNHKSIESTKKLLDSMRKMCRGEKEAIPELYSSFNLETDDGRKMDKYSHLLTEAVHSIIEVKAEQDLLSLFKPGGTSLLSDSFEGIRDFELISFLVVR